MPVKKPTGKNGYVRIQNSEEKPSVIFKQVIFPEIKEEIEMWIVSKFTSEMKKRGCVFLDEAKLNKQDDFDFTLFLSGCDVYLELTEITITIKNEIPYEKLKTLRNYGDVVDNCISLILKKDKKAKKRKTLGNANMPVHLLCYVTHFDFNLNDEVLALIQQGLNNISHEFENIFYLSVIDDDKSELRLLYPSSNPIIEDESLQKLRNKIIINLI